jgi:hypothetical protein
MPSDDPTGRPPTPSDSPPADFGVIVPLKPEHVHWARGAYASVRYFMDDTPVCFLVDADRRHVPPGLVDADGARVVCRDDIDPDEAWELSFGSLRAKNLALWYSPFATFMVVDADAVVWGDMRIHADFERFDFVVDSPIVDPQSVRRSVMDVGADVLSPYLDARQHASAYVNKRFATRTRGGLPATRDTLRLRFEDAACTDFRGTNLRGRWSGLARHTRFRYRALKVHVRRRTPDRIVRMLRGASRREA